MDWEHIGKAERSPEDGIGGHGQGDGHIGPRRDPAYAVAQVDRVEDHDEEHEEEVGDADLNLEQANRGVFVADERPIPNEGGKKNRENRNAGKEGDEAVPDDNHARIIIIF